MTLITLPSGYDFISEEWRIDVPAQVNRSRFTSRRKIVGLPGAETWLARVVVEPIATEVGERPWRAFILSLRGQQNTFQLQANCQNPPSGAVVGAGATNGYTLPLTGMAASTTILRAGEFMTVPLPSGHKRLVCLVADLVANGSGNGTATFEPELSEVPTAATVIELSNPYALVSLRERSNGWVKANGVSQFVLDAEEALNATP